MMQEEDFFRSERLLPYYFAYNELDQADAAGYDWLRRQFKGTLFSAFWTLCFASCGESTNYFVLIRVSVVITKFVILNIIYYFLATWRANTIHAE